jgi:hypothetical protein
MGISMYVDKLQGKISYLNENFKKVMKLIVYLMKKMIV